MSSSSNYAVVYSMKYVRARDRAKRNGLQPQEKAAINAAIQAILDDPSDNDGAGYGLRVDGALMKKCGETRYRVFFRMVEDEQIWFLDLWCVPLM